VSKISKTARSSSVVDVKQKHEETTDEAIKAVRDNLAAGLFVGDMSRVRKLLAAYDEIDQIATKAEADLALSQAEADGLRHKLESLQAEVLPQPATELTGTAAMEG